MSYLYRTDQQSAAMGSITAQFFFHIVATFLIRANTTVLASEPGAVNYIGDKTMRQKIWGDPMTKGERTHEGEAFPSDAQFISDDVEPIPRNVELSGASV